MYYGTAPNIFSGGVRGGTPPGKIRLGGLGAQRLVVNRNRTPRFGGKKSAIEIDSSIWREVIVNTK
jgi:hypothetical protein